MNVNAEQWHMQRSKQRGNSMRKIQFKDQSEPTQLEDAASTEKAYKKNQVVSWL